MLAEQPRHPSLVGRAYGGRCFILVCLRDPEDVDIYTFRKRTDTPVTIFPTLQITSYSELEQYYELRLLEIVVGKLGKDCLCWEEVFDNGVQLPNATIIDVWKGGWNNTIDKAMSSGYKAVLSAPFYLNYISYGDDWKNYYNVRETRK